MSRLMCREVFGQLALITRAPHGSLLLELQNCWWLCTASQGALCTQDLICRTLSALLCLAHTTRRQHKWLITHGSSWFHSAAFISQHFLLPVFHPPFYFSLSFSHFTALFLFLLHCSHFALTYTCLCNETGASTQKCEPEHRNVSCIFSLSAICPIWFKWKMSQIRGS